MSEAGAPRILGIPFIGLSVRDARRSADWYRRLLGMRVQRENFDSANWPSPWNEIPLKDPVSTTGLDHFELEVSGLEELQRWRDQLEELGVAHSGIKDGHLIVVPDPDNIQMEFYWPEH